MTQPRPPMMDDQFSTRAAVASGSAISKPAEDHGADLESSRCGGASLQGAILFVGITCVVVGCIFAVGGLQGTDVIGSLVGARDGVDDFAPGVLLAIFGAVSIYSTDWIDWPGRR